jgi:uncharacterized membrane protein YhiD involved in acid resistance
MRSKTLAVAVVAVLILSILTFSAACQSGRTSAQTNSNVENSNRSNSGNAQNSPTIGQIFGLNNGGSDVANGDRTWIERLVEIFSRLLLAVIFSAALAFRPRQNIPLLKRSLFVSQTQILLAVVAAALMLIVGDNTARAFAIFAAVSLVRFRTNIRDPKEITVLLISLALGLAAGVGRWELGVALCLFSLALLWLLEFNEPEQVFRSMELTVRTRDPDRTQTILKKLFNKYKLEAEVREIEPPDDKKQIGAIVYYLTLPLSLSTDYVSDRISRLDPRNVEGIQWSQKKSPTDIYQ